VKHRNAFSHSLQHPARKWNGSILTTMEPAGTTVVVVVVAVAAAAAAVVHHVLRNGDAAELLREL